MRGWRRQLEGRSLFAGRRLCLRWAAHRPVQQVLDGLWLGSRDAEQLATVPALGDIPVPQLVQARALARPRRQVLGELRAFLAS